MSLARSADQRVSQQPWNSGDPLLSARSVRALLDVSDRGLRRWVAGGRFPKPDVKIGRSLRWKESTVAQFIESSQVRGSGYD